MAPLAWAGTPFPDQFKLGLEIFHLVLSPDAGWSLRSWGINWMNGALPLSDRFNKVCGNGYLLTGMLFLSKIVKHCLTQAHPKKDCEIHIFGIWSQNSLGESFSNVLERRSIVLPWDFKMVFPRNTHFRHIAYLLRKFASTNVLYMMGQMKILSLLGWIYTQAKEVTVYDMMWRLCNKCIAQSFVLE